MFIFDQIFFMKYSFPLFLLTLLSVSLSSNGQLQKINTYAGIGTAGFSGDGGVATAAELNGPQSIVLDAIGNVYFVDFFNGRVRKINTFSKITTIAGNGNFGSGGDGSIATSVPLQPYTVASGNGGIATIAQLNRPNGMAFDSKGNLYIADANNHVVRKLDTFGKIWAFAGDGTMGYTGDNGLATAAQLDSPFALAIDKKDRVYISDYKTHVIRMVDTDDTITTFAGTGVAGYTGNNGPASAATFNGIASITVDSIGNVFIADANNNVIRKIDTFGVVTTVAGNGTSGYGGDLGDVLGANFQHPYGVAVDKYGSLFISDANNHRIRKTYYTVDVKDIPNGATIAAYPNPVHDLISITGAGSTDQIFVYNALGEKINASEEKSGAARILNLNNLTTGVYLVQVCDASGSVSALFKIVKE
jgi:streptogramin lyase